MSLGGLNAKEISDELGVDYETVRCSIKRYRKRNGVSRDCAGRLTSEKVATKISAENNIRAFEDIRKNTKGDDITPELIMIEKGLDPKDWQVVSFTKNAWQQQTKDGDTIDLCQSKLIVKPIDQTGLTISDIDEWFSHHTKFNPMQYTPIQYNTEGEVLEITVSDLHCGLLAYAPEAGEHWDLHICTDKFLGGIEDIIRRSGGKKFKKIYFCTLGDILHVDNVQGTTTKGTVQQIDGRITKIINHAYDMMSTALEMLRSLNAPIEYVYLCGNHDTALGYCLAKMLELTNADIEFDTLPNPQKAIHFGKCLVGLTHGDMPAKNKGQWLINDYRREFGESDFIEEHSGHFHTEMVKEYTSGIITRSCIAQCGNSYWEHQQGYRSQRGIQCFVWNEDTGLRETWYYYY